MALVKQGGTDPNGPKVTTSMGLREPRAPICWKCHERKDQLYTISVNGQPICADCAGSYGKGVLRPDVENGIVETRDPEPQPSSTVPGVVVLDLNEEND